MNELSTNERGHVCLTFDVDGPSLWMMRKMTTPTPVSRGEYTVVGTQRVLRLLARRGIPATFFVPGHTIETYPDVCRAIVDAGHEVGLHGYAHELNPTLSPERERWVMGRSVELVEQVSGVYPRGYRSPAGDLTDQTIAALVEFGVGYDSSLMGHDFRPYPLRAGDELPADGPMRFGAPTGIVELPWSWTLDDYPYLEFVAFRKMVMPGLGRPEDMFANFLGDVAFMVREVRHGVCTVVFHPEVIGRGHRMLALERWLDAVAALGVGFARQCDVAAAAAAGVPFGLEG